MQIVGDWMLGDDIWELGNHKQPTDDFPPNAKQPKHHEQRPVSSCSLTFAQDFISLAATKVILRLVSTSAIL